MTTIRPSLEKGTVHFPVLSLPFDGDIALGNGTQWRMRIFSAGDALMVVMIRPWGAGIFRTVRATTPRIVARRFKGILNGDACNVADLINDQLDAAIRGQCRRYGQYMASCMSVSW